jgi:CDP-diacylglycerol--serine O-phosphatidyltransferase
LPTPANAIFIVFLPFFIEKFELLILFKNIYFLIFIVLLSSYMLISNYPMMSLKLKNLNFNQNKLLLIILLISLILLIIYGIASLPIIIIIYILVNFMRLVF